MATGVGALVASTGGWGEVGFITVLAAFKAVFCGTGVAVGEGSVLIFLAVSGNIADSFFSMALEVTKLVSAIMFDETVTTTLIFSVGMMTGVGVLELAFRFLPLFVSFSVFTSTSLDSLFTSFTTLFSVFISTATLSDATTDAFSSALALLLLLEVCFGLSVLLIAAAEADELLALFEDAGAVVFVVDEVDFEVLDEVIFAFDVDLRLPAEVVVLEIGDTVLSSGSFSESEWWFSEEIGL